MPLGFNDLVALAQRAGLRGDPRVAAAIALAESSGNPQAFNPVGRDHSLGLWQINQLAHKGQFGSDEELKNPETNARAMAALFNRRGNFNDWSTYTSGKYRDFLPGGSRYDALRSAGLAGGSDPTSRSAPAGSMDSGATSLPPTQFPQFDPRMLAMLTPQPRRGLLATLLFGNKGLEGMLPQSVQDHGILGSLFNQASPTASGGTPAAGETSSTSPAPASMLSAPMPSSLDARQPANVPLPPRRRPPSDLQMPDRQQQQQMQPGVTPMAGSPGDDAGLSFDALRSMFGYGIG